jgi:hypothetical protein
MPSRQRQNRKSLLCTIYDARICDLINTDGRRLQQILYTQAMRSSSQKKVVCRAAHITLCTFLCIDETTPTHLPREDRTAYQWTKKERYPVHRQGLRPGIANRTSRRSRAVPLPGRKQKPSTGARGLVCLSLLNCPESCGFVSVSSDRAVV